MATGGAQDAPKPPKPYYTDLHASAGGLFNAELDRHHYPSARARQPFTHFLSVPLAVPGVQEAFTAWREAVLARGSAAPPRSLFQQPALLHLTLGTLALLDNRELELAGELLEECGEQVVRPLLAEGGGLAIANI